MLLPRPALFFNHKFEYNAIYIKIKGDEENKEEKERLILNHNNLAQYQSLHFFSIMYGFMPPYLQAN